MSLLTSYMSRPSYIAETVKDITVMPQINDLRANRLAFLSPEQIIIEKTTDGGITWEDAGVADIDKAKLFSEQRPSILLPRINNERSTLCGLRVTFTAIKYDVPENTLETEKYNYWNPTYFLSTERYSSLREMYFWIGSNGDRMNIRVQRAKGSSPDTWEDCFYNNDALFFGWSGNNYIQFNSTTTFGGNSTQPTNYWNYRVIFMSAYNKNTSAFTQTGAQGIYEIRAYGPTWWTKGTNYAASDHLYSFDYQKNATFPNNVKTTGYFINKYGNLMPYDVRINNSSITTDGVANIPYATTTIPGVIMISGNFNMDNGKLWINNASDNNVKEGTSGTAYLTPSRQHMATFYGLAKAAGDTSQASSSNTVGTYTDDAKTAIKTMLGVVDPTISDVQIDDTSIVNNGTANIPLATTSTVGVVKVNPTFGTSMRSSPNENTIMLSKATADTIKSGSQNYQPIVPTYQQYAVFYGLARAAGDTTQAATQMDPSTELGTYTDNAKAAIQTMLGIDLSSIASQVDIPLTETILGTTVSITGQPNVRYVCGEISTISITPPSVGTMDIIFESGSTAAVLTVPNTVKWPAWFDPESLNSDTVYEILITDGEYGSVITWAT